MNGSVKIGRKRFVDINLEYFTSGNSKENQKRNWREIDGNFWVCVDRGGRHVVYSTIRYEKPRTGMSKMFYSVIPKAKYDEHVKSVDGMDPEEVAVLLNWALNKFRGERVYSAISGGS
jgi:hypothetical protein